ncbi:MAG: D-alanyl-D-alanine carboxypeptidase/D-alanyl-D-alanine-endopeptidase [Aquihabitans sp.]
MIVVLVATLTGGPGLEAAGAVDALATSSPSGATAADPALSALLDRVVADSPDATCLTVQVDGRQIYVHDGERPMIPASTLKLLTASAALDQLGPEHRTTTRVVADASPVKGLVGGDLVLVGGGDPLLTTDLNRLVRHIGDDLHPTSLDRLADEVVDAGVLMISGRVVGDESRYDSARVVDSWPERYITQNQSGPLSALTVDDGYDVSMDGPDGQLIRRRSDDPARSAAAAFSRLLTDRGILIGGDAIAGTAPSNPVELASIESAPLTDVVSELLVTSDNQTAELLTKEMGLAETGEGSTEAGLEVIESHLADHGVAGADLTDGSGLAPSNQVTCDQLVEVLDLTGGIDGSLGSALPVAGESGTLKRRFTDTPAAGLLRAKTGYLAEVTSLAGFVPLASGEVATFAYIANGEVVDDASRVPQDLLAIVLATYEMRCPQSSAIPLVVPMAAYVGPMGALASFPLPSVLLPSGLVTLHVFEDGYRPLVDRCRSEDAGFGVVLISRESTSPESAVPEPVPGDG